MTARRARQDLRVWTISALAASLALSACSEDRVDCVRLYESCNISDPHCQREIFAATACTRGQQGAKMPPIRALTRSQYADELREEASEEDEYGELAWGRALGLFGLIPSEQTYEEASIAESVEFVAAFYRRDTKDVTIIRDNNIGFSRSTQTLSHEFVHALQDQREDLATFYDAHADSSDSVAALKCLTEGEAVVLSNLTMPDFRRIAAGDVLWHTYFGSWLARDLDDLADAEAPLLGAKRLVYPVGGLGVIRAFLGGGRHEIAQLYDTPTLTFLGWAKPGARTLAPAELDCAAPEPPAGFELRFQDQQGMLGLLSLYVALGLNARFDDAQAWSGDSFAVYTPIEEDSEQVAVAWRIRFQEEAAADAFFALLSRGKRELTAQLSGTELLLVAASTPELLDQWAFETCGEVEKSRRTERRRLVVPRTVTRWRAHQHLRSHVLRKPELTAGR